MSNFYSAPSRRRPRGGYRRSRSSFPLALGIGFLLLLFIVVGIKACGAFYNKHSVTFTVQNKERVCSWSSNHQTCKYLIWTDKGVYQDTDSLVYGKFRSSDLYGMLQPGKTFTCEVYGYRSGFLSAYPNIVKCQPA